MTSAGLVGAFLPDMTRLAAGLKKEYLVRWLRRAQKAALIEWRDRRAPPGLAARFTDEGARFYEFAERNPFYNRKKKNLPDFVYTGALRSLMSQRRPQSPRDSVNGIVTTRLKYGGGALNFLVNGHGITASVLTTKTVMVRIGAYERMSKKGKAVAVKGFTQARKVHSFEYQYANRTYAQEFGDFVKDRDWIANRTVELFLEIYRKAVLGRNGEVRSKYLEGVDAT